MKNALWKLLDYYLTRITRQDEPTLRVIQKLVCALDDYRARLTHAEWSILAKQASLHPLHPLLQLDPYTHRAFSKPRGYAGDAPMLDFIYGHRDVAHEVAAATPLGKTVHQFTACKGAPPRAVRRRCEFIVSEIDGLSNDQTRPQIFSLAAIFVKRKKAVPSWRERSDDLLRWTRMSSPWPK